MISVIIPVYNTKKYLNAAVDSVINQSYRDLEIILVDDGSSDGSSEICDEYARKDSRIRVIHKQNAGQSSARNTALDVAKGEYICFVDSDDIAHKEMINVLLNMINSYDADIAVCECMEFPEGDLDNTYIRDIPDKVQKYKNIKILDGNEKFTMLTDMKTKYSSPWVKLYRKELFDKCRFQEGHLHEDQRMLADIVMKVKKAVICDEELYYYMTRSGSSTQKPLDKNRMMDCINAIFHACELLKPAGEFDVQQTMARHSLNQIIFYYEEVERLNLENMKSLRNELRQRFKEIMEFNSNVISYKQVIYNLFRINPKLGIWLKKKRENK